MIDRELTHAEIFPEERLPDPVSLIEKGRQKARDVTIGPCAFLDHHGVACEAEYKRRAMAAGDLMFHAQIGFRDPNKTLEAYGGIYRALTQGGGRLDRFGICLDWSMGYPAAQRQGRPRGTGLLMNAESDFAALTAMAPVAPHFGDFVLGMPAALENTQAALKAGATAIGNLGQYFTFRLPGWEDDVATTTATLEALALIAAQPEKVLVHSNLDDGFAALFADLACSFGAVLLERYIVEDLLGASLSHCYGHTFSEPLSRLAFQRALAQQPGAPGTMVYGNTTLYRGDGSENYAALCSYLSIDLIAQHLAPTGHAVNPVPLTEASRIPDRDEVVMAQKVGQRLAERVPDWAGLIDLAAADRQAATLIQGGMLFKDRVLAGLGAAGVDTQNPLELLLALRRVGARRLEELFGPGAPNADRPRGRQALIPTTEIRDLESRAKSVIDALTPDQRTALAGANLSVCVCATDVHEYGKILLEEILKGLGVTTLDGGIHSEPAAIAALVKAGRADLVAISTYNGIALDYLTAVKQALQAEGLDLPVLIGGRLNQIPEHSNTSLPMDVTAEIAAAGGIACAEADQLLDHLLALLPDQDRGAKT
ncbi:MAG: hypothetical protein AAF530_09035 [Pseudomonadota bacterium]